MGTISSLILWIWVKLSRAAENVLMNGGDMDEAEAALIEAIDIYEVK